MADLVLRADVDQLEQHRVHGDQVDAERLVGRASWSRRSRCRAGRASSPRRRSPRSRRRWRSRRRGCAREIQLIAPPRMAISQPRNSVPRCISCLSRAWPADADMHRARFRDQAFAAHAASPAASRPKAVWSTRTASSISSSAISTLTLISLGDDREHVDAALGQRLEHLRGERRDWSGCRRRRSLTLATASSVSISSIADLVLELFEHRHRLRQRWRAGR